VTNDIINSANELEAEARSARFLALRKELSNARRQAGWQDV
jgi:hypothetical protein